MKHVKVRIAVAVDASGRWCAFGADNDSDEVSKGWALEGWDEGQLRDVVWVEVHVPIPRETCVEGEVVTEGVET